MKRIACLFGIHKWGYLDIARKSKHTWIGKKMNRGLRYNIYEAKRCKHCNKTVIIRTLRKNVNTNYLIINKFL